MRGYLVPIYGIILSVLFAAGGCAAGKRYDYSNLVADIAIEGNLSIAVATHDQRDYVVTGAKHPQFTGVQRGGYGNPFNVSTASGRPLAGEITDILTGSLAKKGFNAAAIDILFSDTPDTVLEKAKAAGSDRIIILTLTDWRSDTYANVALQYDLAINVLSRDGKKLAGKKTAGRENLGGSAMNPPAHARKAVPQELKKKIEELLNSSEIAKTLSK